MPRKTTISLIKCDVGSLAGHHIVPKPLLNIAERNLKKAKEEDLITVIMSSTLEMTSNSLWYTKEARHSQTFTNLHGTPSKKLRTKPWK